MDKEYLIKKWLSNDLSDSETKAFYALEDASLYEEIIEEVQRFNGSSYVEVESFETFDKKLNSQKGTSVQWIKIASGIAAVFVISFALFTLINEKDINVFKTNLAQNEIITLPDKSLVNLNELSKIEYNSFNWDDNRLLKLDGEAYFDVEKGKRFEVNTEYGKVSVLGTEFNILSRDSIFKVSCYEGLVEVAYENNKVKLPAGKELILISGKELMSNIVVSEPYWLKNLSVFENASFVDVIKEFERQYNISVNYPLEININFTGAFEHNNLENALKSILQPLNLTYTISNNEVVIRE